MVLLAWPAVNLWSTTWHLVEATQVARTDHSGLRASHRKGTRRRSSALELDWFGVGWFVRWLVGWFVRWLNVRSVTRCACYYQPRPRGGRPLTLASFFARSCRFVGSAFINSPVASGKQGFLNGTKGGAGGVGPMGGDMYADDSPLMPFNSCLLYTSPSPRDRG